MKISIVYRENDFLKAVVAKLVEQLRQEHEVVMLSFPPGTTREVIRSHFDGCLDQFKDVLIFSDQTCYFTLQDAVEEYACQLHGLNRRYDNPYHHARGRETLKPYENRVILDSLVIPSFLGVMGFTEKELCSRQSQISQTGKVEQFSEEQSLLFLERDIKPVYRKLLLPAVNIERAVVVSEKIGDHPPFGLLSTGPYVENNLGWPEERTAQYFAGWLREMGFRVDVVGNRRDLTTEQISAIKSSETLLFVDHHSVQKWKDSNEFREIYIGTCLCDLPKVANLYQDQKTGGSLSQDIQQKMVELALQELRKRQK